MLYHIGDSLYLEGEIAQVAKDYQNKAIESDEREGLVKTYLNNLLPENWDKLGLGERRDYLAGFNNSGVLERLFVCNLEIWSECFNKDPSSIRKSDSYEIGTIMKHMDDWIKYEGNKSRTKRFPIYGKQQAYVKKTK